MPTEKRVIEFSRSDFQALADGEEIRLDANGSGAWVRADPEIATGVEPEGDDTPEPPGRDGAVGELEEGTQLYEFAIYVSNHPKEWVANGDVVGFFEDSDAESDAGRLASNHLGDLYRKGAAERDEEAYPYQYRLKEWYRREFSQYDSLNGGRDD